MNSTSTLIAQDFNHQAIDLFQAYTNTYLLVLIYNNQCLGCTGRAIPLANEFQLQFHDLQVIGIHTNFTNTPIRYDEIKSIFTTKKLPFPIYIDRQQTIYKNFKAEGTPYWLIFNKQHQLIHSLFGSQENAQIRLKYALEEIFYSA